jgi:hypothetical protein
MTLEIRTEHIELDQALKLAALVGSGGEAKMAIQSGWVKVNGVTEFDAEGNLGKATFLNSPMWRPLSYLAAATPDLAREMCDERVGKEASS